MEHRIDFGELLHKFELWLQGDGYAVRKTSQVELHLADGKTVVTRVQDLQLWPGWIVCCDPKADKSAAIVRLDQVIGATIHVIERVRGREG